MSEEFRFSTGRVWAIQLSDTEHRTWVDRDDVSQVYFNWNDFVIKNTSDFDDILISITQREFENYNRDNREKIKNLARGVYAYSNLRVNDGILAVHGKRSLKKMGRIIQIMPSLENLNGIIINIRWYYNSKNALAERDIFNVNAEIERIDARMMYNLRVPLEIILGNDSEILPNLIVKGTNLFRSFDLSRSLEYRRKPSLESISQKKDKGGTIPLFYGTNRNLTGKNDYEDFYGDKLDSLKFGRCIVSIPKEHVRGDLERPKLFKFEINENPDKHIVIKSISEMDEQVFFEIINSDLKNADHKSALVFIHGYNTTFAEAARRAAQIAWDVRFKGVPGFFSWPSRGTMLSYLADGDKTISTIPFFEEFIEKLIFKTNVEKIHFIAHSMGNTLLTTTLNNLSDKPTLTGKLDIIRQIVLGAPDVAQNIFENTILPKLKSVGKSRTLYSSDKDLAIKISEFVHSNDPRLGDAGDSLFVKEGLDTIDASNVDSSGYFEHGYIFNSKELLTDLHYLLNEETPVEKRDLREREKDNLKYWLFAE